MKIKELVVIGVLLCSTAYASEVVMQGGWSHTNESNYGDSATAVIRLENPLFDRLNWGIEGGYHGPQSHYPEDKGVHSYGDLSGYHIIGDLIWYPKTNWRLDPYLIAGAGWSWWSFDRSQEVKDLGIDIKMGDAFCYKAGVGADLPINEHWSLNGEFKFFKADIPKNSGDSIILTDQSKIGQEELNFVVGLKYRW